MKTSLTLALAAVAMMVGGGVASASEKVVKHHAHHQVHATQHKTVKHYAAKKHTTKHIASKPSHKHFAAKKHTLKHVASSTRPSELPRSTITSTTAEFYRRGARLAPRIFQLGRHVAPREAVPITRLVEPKSLQRRVASIPATILRADIHNLGCRTLSLQFQGCDKRVLAIDQDMPHLPLKFEPDGELHVHLL